MEHQVGLADVPDNVVENVVLRNPEPAELLLFGGESFGQCKQVANWDWAVDSPSGSTSTFVPNAQAQSPTFSANVAGIYRFRLEVQGKDGQSGCGPWMGQVLVLPD
ncbi:MAG: hypothetical protein ACI9OJ_000046 [Myxococcota bacterium]|jgi:hypothetical protein